MTALEIKAVLGDLLSKRLDTAQVRSHEHSWASELWAELVELGMASIDVPEENGGMGGGSLEAALAVIELCGRHNANLPIVDVGFVGSWVLAKTDLTQPEALDGIAVCDGGSLRVTTNGALTILSGEAEVPWGRFADRLLVLRDKGLGMQLLVIDPSRAKDSLTWTHGRNLAGEPRDRVTMTDTVAVTVHDLPISPMQLQARLGLGKAALMLGALEKVVELAIDQVSTREQFGRPLSKFQVIQHYMASMVAELATLRAAVDRAISRCGTSGDIDVSSAATAKIRAGAAAATITVLAHQVHGAMGVTEEHELGLSTRRLWAWRDEGGEEQFWSRVLGREVASAAYLSSLWSVLEPIE